MLEQLFSNGSIKIKIFGSEGPKNVLNFEVAAQRDSFPVMGGHRRVKALHQVSKGPNDPHQAEVQVAEMKPVFLQHLFFHVSKEQ